MADNILSSLDECIKSFSFDGYGWAPLSRPFSMDVYERWIASGFHGEMTYLERHIEQKREPRRWMNAARSALVVTRDYLSRREASPFPTLRIARYARGADYHDWFRQTIEDLGASIRQLHPAFEWKTFTDSSPVL
jgi:epoxyqueuosine reductase